MRGRTKQRRFLCDLDCAPGDFPTAKAHLALLAHQSHAQADRRTEEVHRRKRDALRSIPRMVANVLRWPAEVGTKFGGLLDAQQLELESASGTMSSSLIGGPAYSAS